MSRRLLILMWHRVLPAPDPLRPDDPDARAFARCAALLRRLFKVLSFEEAVRALSAGTLPSRAACVTFDDGYADNLEIALPILQRFDLPATVFVATSHLDGGRMWNDSVIELVRGHAAPELDARSIGCGVFDVRTDEARLHAVNELIKALKYRSLTDRQRAVDTLAAELGVELPADLMLKREGVMELARAGVEIGGHSHTHPILARLTDDEARNEIDHNRRELAGILGRAPRFFAYPNGRPGRDYTDREVQLVKDAGYEAAVSTRPGAARSGDAVYELPRFGPWQEPRYKLAARLLKMSYA
jgi:peptidoglycan/xylan/chitin deacetylase (PgdA/CDA1 family)